MTVFPATVVTGARQTGKSTLVRQPQVTGERLYLTLDDVLVRDQAERDPETLLERAERMVLDEVQRAPDLLLALKLAIDEKRELGRFVLTGSADLLLMERISESLAGRAGYVTLWPLTRREQLGLASAGAWSELMVTEPADWRDVVESQTVPAERWQDLARRGGYPVPVTQLSTDAQRRDWFAGYTATYLERDLRHLSAIANLADMRRLMTTLSLRIGKLLNQAEVSRDLGLPTSTIHRHMNLLEVSYQLVRLPAYAVNRTKRLIKSPKIYWSDTGLALYLAGEVEPQGRHLENVVATDLLSWASLHDGPVSILFWRTVGGAEVDFVIETPRRVLPLEVKATTRVRVADARHLELFLDEYDDQAAAGLLLYAGDETFWLTRRVLAAPWHRII